MSIKDESLFEEFGDLGEVDKELNEEQIILAIENDALDTFKLLINRGVAVKDISIGFGMSAFEYAIRCQSNAILQEMLNTGMHDPLEGEYLRTKRAAIDQVARSLDQKKGTVTANYAVRYAEDIEEYIIGSPPIILAAIYGDVKTLEILLESGSDINARDYTINKTPLMWAIDAYDLEMDDTLSKVEYLLKHGANLIELEDDEGRSSYHYLLRVFDYEELRNLLSLSPFNTPLDLWFKEVAILEKLAHDPAHAKILNEFIPEWEEYRDNKGMMHEITPLMVASRFDKWSEVTKLLLAHGAGINLAANTEWTPLIYAVNSGSVENVKVLIEGGGNVNITIGGDIRITLLEFSIAKPYVDSEIVELLLKGGASTEGNPNWTIEKQREGLHAQGKEKEIDLSEIAIFNHISIPIELIGSPVIIQASLTASPEVLEIVLAAGVDVNALDFTTNRTALMWACEALLDDYSGTDDYYIYEDWLDVLELLVENGADLTEIKDAEGLSGFDYVEEIFDEKGIEELAGDALLSAMDSIYEGEYFEEND